MSRTDRPARDLVRRALDAVIASEAFARSERLRSFLSYIVENELAGKAAQLKGYSVGIDVFGRPPGFDAGNDPLVRVQAGKLRKLLEQYYETEGAADCVRIRVPLGSYVPEYSVREKWPEAVSEIPACEAAPAPRAARQKSSARGSWRPPPVSSPLALLSLLPLVFLAPSVYPETTNAAITNAQFTLSAQNGLDGRAQALPRLHVLQCWPAGGKCNDLARAISNSAGYHKTVRLLEAREPGKPHPLSYTVRIENHSGSQGIYVRLMHERSGETIYARHFSREQVHSEAGIAYEAVAFAARAFSASGPLYRHAMRAGTASGMMECLAHMEQGSAQGAPPYGRAIECTAPAPQNLVRADVPGGVATMAR